MNNLNANLKSIGISVYNPDTDLNQSDWHGIEEIIIDALYKCETDRKLFGLICSWGSIYGSKIIAEKFIKIYRQKLERNKDSIWIQMFLIFLTSKGERRFKSIITKQKKTVYPRDYYKDSIKLKGFDPIFKKFNILIPKGFIKITSKNIMPPEILIKTNLILKNRYLIGANWRADIISAIELGIENPYRISKTIGCSYDPAYRVFKEYEIANS